jgi:hypothetical protein
MSINIQYRLPQYKSLTPLAKCESIQLNQLPSIGSVFPEFFNKRVEVITQRESSYIQVPEAKPAFRRIIANAANYNATIAAQRRNNPSVLKNEHHQRNTVNYSMPFLYSTQGKLRSRIQSKSFLPRRKRVTAQQLQVLNSVFRQNPFPSIEERFNLSERLGISARSIQIWFQNKRQTVRSFTHE